jgi:hypothetical protein
MTIDQHLTANRSIILLALQYGVVPTLAQMAKCDDLCSEGGDEYMAAWIVTRACVRDASGFHPRRKSRGGSSASTEVSRCRQNQTGN